MAQLAGRFPDTFIRVLQEELEVVEAERLRSVCRQWNVVLGDVSEPSLKFKYMEVIDDNVTFRFGSTINNFRDCTFSLLGKPPQTCGVRRFNLAELRSIVRHIHTVECIIVRIKDQSNLRRVVKFIDNLAVKCTSFSLTIQMEFPMTGFEVLQLVRPLLPKMTDLVVEHFTENVELVKRTARSDGAEFLLNVIHHARFLKVLAIPDYLIGSNFDCPPTSILNLFRLTLRITPQQASMPFTSNFIPHSAIDMMKGGIAVLEIYVSEHLTLVENNKSADEMCAQLLESIRDKMSQLPVKLPRALKVHMYGRSPWVAKLVASHSGFSCVCSFFVHVKDDTKSD